MRLSQATITVLLVLTTLLVTVLGAISRPARHVKDGIFGSTCYGRGELVSFSLIPVKNAQCSHRTSEIISYCKCDEGFGGLCCEKLVGRPCRKHASKDKANLCDHGFKCLYVDMRCNGNEDDCQEAHGYCLPKKFVDSMHHHGPHILPRQGERVCNRLNTQHFTFAEVEEIISDPCLNVSKNIVS